MLPQSIVYFQMIMSLPEQFLIRFVLVIQLILYMSIVVVARWVMMTIAIVASKSVQTKIIGKKTLQLVGQKGIDKPLCTCLTL